MGKLIAIASAKGGVGKTTTALNLGNALTLLGKKTLVVDGNLTTPSISLHLGVGHISPTISEVLTEKIPVSEAIFRHQSGMDIIAASMKHRGRKDNWPVEELKSKADIILVDTASDPEDSILERADSAILVTTPDLPAVAATLKTADALRKKNIPVIGTIINKKTNDPTEMHNYDIKQLLDAPILGCIPEDKEIKRSIKLNNPVVHINPNADSSIQFKKIAAHLLGQSYKTNLAPKKQTFSQWFIKALKN